MEIVEDSGHTLKFRVSAKLLGYMSQHRIRTANDPTRQRWQPDDVISAAGDAHFHSYTMLLAGNHVTKLGSFSYSFSALNQWITVGRYCSIAADVRLMGPQHPMHYVTSSEMLYRKNGMFSDSFADFGAEHWTPFPNPQPPPVTIGNDVWIGQNVLLKGGISIGDGAVIGAGAVVVKSVTPYEVVGGVPARRLKLRFDAPIVAKLRDLAWWRYAIGAAPQLAWNKPERFIDQMRELIDQDRIVPFESDLGSIRGLAGQL